MAKTEKRISINVLDKIAKENFENISVQEWFGVEIEIKRSLGLTDILEFVNDVTISCFGESGNFLPEVLDFAIKSNILTRYANLTMPENLEHRYKLIYHTDIVDAVCNHINMAQLKEVVSSINRKIDYLCSVNVSVIQRKLTELVSAFENMQKQTGNIFDGVSSDDVNKLLGAINNGTFSEDKVVEAYMRQMNKPLEDGVGSNG